MAAISSPSMLAALILAPASGRKRTSIEVICCGPAANRPAPTSAPSNSSPTSSALRAVSAPMALAESAISPGKLSLPERSS